ncbi:MAG: hypothetical protein KDC73_08115 [Ignavibacteriae bacterium]|nr:hypothetical protein [Ignavibacteriota bacterium]MCB9242330.1 hypothetical protein [Ignavibacteriales bacterium]
MTMHIRMMVFMGAILSVFLVSNISFSLDNDPYGGDPSKGYDYPNLDKPQRSQWGFNAMYSEKGFGISSEYFVNIWKNTDLVAGLGFSSVSDDREFQEFDYFGNSYTPDKVNRVFMAPLSIGIKHALFQDDIDGSLKPTVSAGVAPTLILTNPYSTNFFPALGKFNAAFAFGPYAGIGLNFTQNKSVAYSFNINYYYLPVIGKEVMSLQNKPIDNVGGVQFTVGINLLH